jgi:hypothetical protein
MARAGTEALRSSATALPRQEGFATLLAMSFVHSGDANLAPLQAQGRLPAVADLRADVPAVPSAAASRRVCHWASRFPRRCAFPAERRHEREQKRWGSPPRPPGMPCRMSRNAARALRDANWAMFQAQGPMPSLADWRAGAGAERAAGICLSRTDRSSGAARTRRRSSGRSCQQCPPSPPGRLPAAGRGVR